MRWVQLSLQSLPYHTKVDRCLETLFSGLNGPSLRLSLPETSVQRMLNSQEALSREHRQTIRRHRDGPDDILYGALILLRSITVKIPEIAWPLTLTRSQEHNVSDFLSVILPEHLLSQEDNPLRPQTPEHNVPQRPDQDPGFWTEQDDRRRGVTGRTDIRGHGYACVPAAGDTLVRVK
jgi:hypothetical protein